MSVDDSSGGSSKIKSNIKNASAGGKVLSNFYHFNPLTRVCRFAFETMDDIYDMGKNKMGSAVSAATAGVATCCCCKVEWIKLDIFRDFFQMIGLLFANISNDAMKIGKYVWGNIGSFIAIDWAFFIKISQIFIYAVLGLIGFIVVLFYLFLAYVSIRTNPDEIREGHEARGWDQLSKKKCFTVKYIGIVISILISLYLPISRSVVQILACDSTMGLALHRLDKSLNCTQKYEDNMEPYWDCDCKDWSLYGLFQICAIILLVIITIGFPLFCGYITYKNVPRGSIDHPGKVYDDFGNLVDYTNEMYKDDLMNNASQKKCPYRFLYLGYERRWAFFKTYMMVMKLVLVTPVILFYYNITYQSIASCVIALFMVIMSGISAPFLNDQSDNMDLSGKTATFFTTLCGLLSCKDIWPGGSTVLGILINLINVISVFLMIGFTLYGMPFVRKIIRNIDRSLVFENSVTNEMGGTKIIKNWNLDKEVKVRVWHRFWNSLMLNLCGKDVMNRMEEIKDAVQRWGVDLVRNHVEGLKDPEEEVRRKFVLDNLEGVDVYWTESTNNLQCLSKSHFGKLWVNSYPFVCIVVYDDSNDYCYVRPENFKKFVDINQTPDVVEKRNIREIIRSLGKEQLFVDFNFKETKRVRKANYRTENGKTKRDKKNYGKRELDVHYDKASFTVKGNTDLVMAAGYKVKVQLEGIGTCTINGKVYEVPCKREIKAEELGFTDDWNISEKLHNMIYDPRNVEIWQKTIQKYKETVTKYRESLKKVSDKKEGVISNSFWLYVYDNCTISYDDLVDYLTNKETNKTLNKIPRQHLKGLQSLYNRIEFVTSHPSMALWYVFFDEVWESNQDIRCINKNKKLLDPRQKTCICYTPLSREDLEKTLKEKGLLKKRRLFSKKILDCLYERIDQLNKEFVPNEKIEQNPNNNNNNNNNQQPIESSEPTIPPPNSAENITYTTDNTANTVVDNNNLNKVETTPVEPIRDMNEIKPTTTTTESETKTVEEEKDEVNTSESTNKEEEPKKEGLMSKFKLKIGKKDEISPVQPIKEEENPKDEVKTAEPPPPSPPPPTTTTSTTTTTQEEPKKEGLMSKFKTKIGKKDETKEEKKEEVKPVVNEPPPTDVKKEERKKEDEVKKPGLISKFKIGGKK